MNNLTPNYKTLTRIPLFRRAVLQSFPFIEEDFDALTDYELLCKVVEYLNKVIEQQNLVGENTDELLRVYLELKDYVEHYFDNLDVQDEIDNKIDRMVEDGTLQANIYKYLDNNLCEYIFPKFMPNESSGDANLIKYENKIIMIDCEKPSAWIYIKQMLDTNDITHIDYMIITHYHIDHYGNLENLINNGYIDSTTHFYMSAEVTNFNVDTVIASLKQLFLANGLTWYVPYEGETLVIDKLKLTFTNCDKDILDVYYTNGDENNCSLIILVEHNLAKTLYMGDAHGEVQKRLDTLNFVPFTIDLYKIGHHGVDNLSYSPFLNYIRPTFAVQSGGIGFFSIGEYSLSADVNLLSKLGTKIYPTFMQDDYVRFVSNGYNVQVKKGIASSFAMSNQTRNIYVDINASLQDIQDGSREHPFSEVMQAISQVEEFEGILTTIHIAEGVYGESITTQQLTSEKNRITIAKHSSIILTNDTNDNSKVVLNGVNILNGYVRLEKLTINNKNHDGIYCRNASVEVDNCIITNTDEELSTHNGIYARNSRVSIVSSTIDYSTPMIYVTQNSIITYKALTFGNNNSGGINNNKGFIYGNEPTFENNTTKLSHLRQYTQKLMPVQIYYNNTEEYNSTEQNYSNNSNINLDTFRYFVIEYTAQNSYKYFSSGEIISPGQNLIGIDAIYTQESDSARTDRITTVGIRLQNNKFQYVNPKTTNIRLDKTNNTVETTMTDVRHIHVRRITAYYEDNTMFLN